MSLPHALLTSLIERPSTGYDLARRYDSSINHFWQATHQQIYRELARMEERGWVTVSATKGATSPTSQDRSGRRKVYRVLASGRRELARWAAEGGDPPVVRDPLLVRLRADATLGSLDLGDQVRERLAHHEGRLTAYREIDERDFGGTLDRTQRLQKVVLAAGIRYHEAEAAWCRDVIDVLADAK